MSDSNEKVVSTGRIAKDPVKEARRIEKVLAGTTLDLGGHLIAFAEEHQWTTRESVRPPASSMGELFTDRCVAVNDLTRQLAETDAQKQVAAAVAEEKEKCAQEVQRLSGEARQSGEKIAALEAQLEKLAAISGIRTENDNGAKVDLKHIAWDGDVNEQVEALLESNSWTPEDSTFFRPTPTVLKPIMSAVRRAAPVYLQGEAGTGKTSMIRWLANKCGAPLIYVCLDGDMTPHQLVGRPTAKQGTIGWADAFVTIAARNGYWLLVDEANAAPPGTGFLFHPLAEPSTGGVFLPEANEFVKAKPTFRLFATGNPEGNADYAGTHTSNAALLSRFRRGAFLNIDYPTEQKESTLLLRAANSTSYAPEFPLQQDDADRIARVARKARDARANDTIVFLWCMRTSLGFADMMQDLGDWKKAFQSVVECPAGSDDARTLYDYCENVWPSA
jgi:MoxR-like ATPase